MISEQPNNPAYLRNLGALDDDMARVDLMLYRRIPGTMSWEGIRMTESEWMSLAEARALFEQLSTSIPVDR